MMVSLEDKMLGRTIGTSDCTLSAVAYRERVLSDYDCYTDRSTMSDGSSQFPDTGNTPATDILLQLAAVKEEEFVVQERSEGRGGRCKNDGNMK